MFHRIINQIRTIEFVFHCLLQYKLPIKIEKKNKSFYDPKETNINSHFSYLFWGEQNNASGENLSITNKNQYNYSYLCGRSDWYRTWIRQPEPQHSLTSEKLLFSVKSEWYLFSANCCGRQMRSIDYCNEVNLRLSQIH